LATEEDASAIAATFDGRNALPLPPRVRAALPALLRQLVASPACTVTAFEDASGSGSRIVSMAGGMFVRDEAIEAYLANPQPALVGSILADLLDGRRPLLTYDEMRRANSGDGLDLAVFPVPLGRNDLDDPFGVELRKLAPQAFVRYYAGYRLRSIYYEVFTDQVAEYLQSGGYRLLHDFATRAGTGFLGPQCRPRMLRLTRADLPPGAMSLATQMFDPPPAKLGLTPAEQRVALNALDGAPDRGIAQSLGLSEETVRANWRSIYQRLVAELPGADPGQRGVKDGKRGAEKRRSAIEYLRQNMHELRPIERAARRAVPPQPDGR
jgi:DNA-binding CsgD family transcriptional regulator